MAREHRTGTREEWLAARRRLLEHERQLTHLSDELAHQRRQLPWVPLDTEYAFDTTDGTRTLRELFDGRPQLLVYHFMFGPGETAGCPSCSMAADHFEGPLPHLNERGVSFVCVSRAPLPAIEAYRRRMGWRFRWVSSLDSDFNVDFGVSFTPEQQATSGEYGYAPIEHPPADLPGFSAFALEDGVVHHTYSCYGRGVDALLGVYGLLDRAPFGRDEDDLPWPMAWVRRRDEYGPAPPPRRGAAFLGALC
jgi:predicted dithiol-disulfide oxidoreductase (DUF899 family)